MGCLMSKKSSQNSSSSNSNNNHETGNVNAIDQCNQINQHINNSKQYSWSNRSRIDLSRYVVENLSDSVEIRLQGEINGEQFIVQNCQRSTVCLFDYINTIMIDDCVDCTFFIGPVVGSVAVRNCSNCRLMSASQQFRTRDCKQMDLFLFSGTQPAIESCHQLRIGCYCANYSGLREQFAKANLNIFNNGWSHVYDFSPEDKEKHWSPISQNINVNDYFRTVHQSGMIDPKLNLSFHSLASFVPKTLGILSLNILSIKQNSEQCYALNEDYANDDDDDDDNFDKNNVSSTGEPKNQSNRFCLALVYGANSIENTSTASGTIESKMEQIVQEINLRYKDLTLMMTKFVDLEQGNLKVARLQLDCSVRNNENNQKQQQQVEQFNVDSLGILLYQGDAAAHVVTDICDRLFDGQCPDQQGSKPTIRYKLIDNDHEDNNFHHYIAIAFDNLVGSIG